LVNSIGPLEERLSLGHSSLSLQHNLDNVVLSATEHSVSLTGLVERHDVTDQGSGIEVSTLDVTEKFLPVLLNKDLATAHVDALLHQGTDGKLITPTEVVANERNVAVLATELYHLVDDVKGISFLFGTELTLVEFRFREAESHTINASVRASRHNLLDAFDDIALGEVDYFSAKLACKFEAIGLRIDRDDSRGSSESSPEHGS